jgi:arginine decarboxylase
LTLHSIKKNGRRAEPYYLGIFIVGAYQDVMGDLHNLYGRVNEMHVFLDSDEPDGYYIEETLRGHSICDCLTTMQYDRRELTRQMKRQIDAAIKDDRLQPSMGMQMLRDYERGLDDYTYLSF